MNWLRNGGAFLGMLLLAATVRAQVLNLPPRAANALGGQQFVNVITPMATPPDAQRENWIYAQIANGNIPSWLRQLVPITTNAVIGGVNHTITYYVAPDYMAIGSDTDYLLEPMTPLLAQRVSVLLGCTLPTRKMVNDIWTAAPLKLAPNPIPYNATNLIETVPYFNQENSMVWAQRVATLPTPYPLGTLVSGDKKDVIISSYIYNDLTSGVPNPVVIYGWIQLSPYNTPIQPLFNGHEEYYEDYSHGIRMVQQAAVVDGLPTTISAVLTNAALAALLSDETLFAGNVIPQPYYTVGATAPVIINQPYSLSVKQGANVSFSVLAAGDAPLTYNWIYNGRQIASSTNAVFSLTNVTGANAGTYTVTAVNNAGSVASLPALLNVSSNSFPVLFADNFDVDSSANWNFFWGADDNKPDYTTNWAFNYGVIPYTYNGTTCLIPPAPNSTNGSSSGVKFTVNNTNAVNAGVNIYPKGQSFSGNFALKFDMWINYPGNAQGSGAAGTTQFAIFGLNFLGTEVNWGATNPPATDGLWFGNDGDGGAVRDYRAYLGNRSGVQTELIGTALSGLSYSNHIAAIYTSLLPTPPSETTGTPGKTWAAMEIDQTNGMLLWKLNGTVIAQRANASGFTSGDVMLGLMDVFPSIASPASDCYVLYDNVRVENLSVPPLMAPVITAQPAGTNLNPGNTALFAAAANGATPFGYQWFFNGMALAGETNFSLSVSNVQPIQGGSYYVQISNAAGSALSAPAVLAVSSNITLASPQLVNQQFHFTLLGLTNLNYVIESSSNLINWVPLATNAPQIFTFSASSSALFYRARPAP